jgi:hypothetical protein
LPEVLDRVHSAAGLGVLERAVQRRVQGSALFGVEVVVRHHQYV